VRAEIVQSNVKQLTELDSLVYKKYNNPEFESHLNIPFRIVIMQFDGALNRVEVIITRLQNRILMLRYQSTMTLKDK
jgi:hypothetical protein